VTAVQPPTENEILAVASLWRAARREVVTSFQGTSMLPTIAPGVEVLLDCGREWQIGDIIAFVDSGHLAVHRIMAASADRQWLLTRGDHRIIPDEPFEAQDAVIGVITRVRVREEWIAPSPLQKSWLRERVLQRAVREFNVSAHACKKQLFLWQRIAWFFRLGPRIAGKVWRLLRLQS
jgi:hypothetical protein